MLITSRAYHSINLQKRR